MTAKNSLVKNWQDFAEDWINQNTKNEDRLWNSAEKLEPTELGWIIKYAIENKTNLSNRQFYWLIGILCIKLENYHSLNLDARFDVNLIDVRNFKKKLVALLKEWDPVTHVRLPVKIFPKKNENGKVNSMTEEISRRLFSEIQSPFQVKAIQSVYYILLLNLDEYPHKKLIFLLTSLLYTSDENSKWQEFVTNEFSDFNTLNNIAAKIPDEVEDIRFKSFFLDYYCQYFLKKRTSEVYNGRGSINTKIRDIAGCDTPVGEILLIIFFIDKYPKCLNFESSQYKMLMNLLSTWMGRITEDLIDKVKNIKIQQKINLINETDYDS